jgi:hypothetical protein
MGDGADMGDRIAALDRMYSKETTANILWDLRAIEVESAERFDDEEVELDSNYIIKRILSGNAKSAAKRRKTAFVFDSNAEVVGAYARRTAEIYRSKTEDIEFELFNDIDAAMAWINEGRSSA